MNRLYTIGDKVIPIKKSSRDRDFDNCATFYKRQELNQSFLYIVGYDEVVASKNNENTYWCDVIFHEASGDSFSESDLIKYEESK